MPHKPGHKKKEEREIIDKKIEITRRGSRITIGKIQEEKPRFVGVTRREDGVPVTRQEQRGTISQQKRFEGAESPATVRLRELAKGKEFLKAGTPEQIQLRKEFPIGSPQTFDPEAGFPSPEEFRRDLGLPPPSELAQQVGQAAQITPDEIAKMSPEQLKQFQEGIPMRPSDVMSYEQAWKSALAGAGIGAAAGVGLGLFTGGVASIPLAILGAIGGFATGFFSNIGAQRADMLKGESANVRKQEQNMLKLVMDVNRGGDPARNLEFFNSQMALISENFARLHMKSNDELSLWLGDDGHIQLERYEVFYSPGGMRDILTAQMRDALANPNLMANVQLEAWLTNEGEESE